MAAVLCWRKIKSVYIIYTKSGKLFKHTNSLQFKLQWSISMSFIFWNIIYIKFLLISALLCLLQFEHPYWMPKCWLSFKASAWTCLENVNVFNCSGPNMPNFVFLVVIIHSLFYMFRLTWPYDATNLSYKTRCVQGDIQTEDKGLFS